MQSSELRLKTTCSCAGSWFHGRPRDRYVPIVACVYWTLSEAMRIVPHLWELQGLEFEDGYYRTCNITIAVQPLQLALTKNHFTLSILITASCATLNLHHSQPLRKASYSSHRVLLVNQVLIWLSKTSCDTKSCMIDYKPSCLLRKAVAIMKSDDSCKQTRKAISVSKEVSWCTFVQRFACLRMVFFCCEQSDLWDMRMTWLADTLHPKMIFIKLRPL